MPEEVYVLSKELHKDDIPVSRPMRSEGEVYKTTRPMAERRVRHGLVEIIGSANEMSMEMAEKKAFKPDIEQRVPEGPTEHKVDQAMEEVGADAVSAEDLISRTSPNSPYFNVEGYDDNPVLGREEALDVARDVLSQ